MSVRPSAPALPNDSADWRTLWTGAPGLRLATLAAGVALHAINLYLTASTLPSVVGDIGGMSLYAWNTTLFIVASIVGATLAVPLIGRIGAHRAYLGACVAFGAGSALCMLAPAMSTLLVGRALQGLGGGVLLAAPYALMRELLPAHLWPRALATLSGMWGVATFVGPAIGGAFAQYTSWRHAFAVLLPATALLAFGAARALRAVSPQRPGGEGPAWRQLALLVLAVLLASSSTVAPSPGWGALALVASAAVFIAIRRCELAGPCRLLPLDTYRRDGALGAMYATSALLAVTVTSSEAFVPLFLQRNHGHTPLAAGYIAAVASAGWTAGSVLSASLPRAWALRVARWACWSCAAAAAGLAVALSTVVPAVGPTMGGAGLGLTGFVVGAQLLAGFGVGLAWPHLGAAIMASAPEGDAERASGAIMTVQLVATTLAVAVGGWLIEVTSDRHAGDLSAPAAWLFGLLALAPLLARWSWPRALAH